MAASSSHTRCATGLRRASLNRLTAHMGHTSFIADNRGHLLPGVIKRGSAWPDFQGTWDHIPAPRRINPTGRSAAGLSRLKSWGFDVEVTDNNTTAGPQEVRQQMEGGEQQDCAAPTADETVQEEETSSSQQKHDDEPQELI